MKLDLTLMAILKLRFSMTSHLHFKGDRRQIVGTTSVTQTFLRESFTQGRIQEFLMGGGGDPKFDSERTVELFCGKLLLSHALK